MVKLVREWIVGKGEHAWAKSWSTDPRYADYQHVPIIVDQTLPSPAMKGLARLLAMGLAGKPVGRAIGMAGACTRFARSPRKVSF